MTKKACLFLLYISVNSCYSQYFSFQGEINSQYGFGYNAGLNFTTDSYFTSDDKVGPALALAEVYVLLERNTALSPGFYPVIGIGYEYFRKPKKAGREYSTRTGLGLYAGANFKSFQQETERCNQLNLEAGLSLCSVLSIGYGRNMVTSYPANFQGMNRDYFFLRITLGVKRTLFTLMDLAGGMV